MTASAPVVTNRTQSRPTQRTSPGTAPRPAAGPARTDAKPRVEHPILFQQFFKSVGPRTYAAQVKVATNGNHYLVITEGRRDKESGEVRKMRLNVFSEDFEAFFGLLRETAQFIRAHPLPPEYQAKRKEFWKKTKGGKRPRGNGKSE